MNKFLSFVLLSTLLCTFLCHIYTVKCQSISALSSEELGTVTDPVVSCHHKKCVLQSLLSAPVRGFLGLLEHVEVEDSAHIWTHTYKEKKAQRLVQRLFMRRWRSFQCPLEPRKFCSIVLECRKPEKKCFYRTDMQSFMYHWTKLQSVLKLRTETFTAIQHFWKGFIY